MSDFEKRREKLEEFDKIIDKVIDGDLQFIIKEEGKIKDIIQKLDFSKNDSEKAFFFLKNATAQLRQIKARKNWDDDIYKLYEMAINKFEELKIPVILPSKEEIQDMYKKKKYVN